MRISLRHIARRAEVSVVTVSKALRGLPGVNPETRDRICTLARELGYVRDPTLANALAYARRRDKPVYRETLAFLADLSPRAYGDMPWLAEIHEGAARRAHELGYALDRFVYPSTPRGQQSLGRQLIARGTHGIIVTPGIIQVPFHLDLDWTKFAAVEIGQTLHGSTLSRIVGDLVEDFAAMFEELRLRGYRRIGMAMAEREEMRRNWATLSAYLVFQYRNPSVAHIPPLNDYSPGNLPRWLADQRPDVVVTNGPWLQEGPCQLPAGIDLCRIDAFAGNDSGLRPDYDNMGWTAVNMLALKLQHRGAGHEEKRQSVCVPNAWHEGRTLRPRPSDAPAIALSVAVDAR